MLLQGGQLDALHFAVLFPNLWKQHIAALVSSPAAQVPLLFSGTSQGTESPALSLFSHGNELKAAQLPKTCLLRQEQGESLTEFKKSWGLIAATEQTSRM